VVPDNTKNVIDGIAFISLDTSITYSSQSDTVDNNGLCVDCVTPKRNNTVAHLETHVDSNASDPGTRETRRSFPCGHCFPLCRETVSPADDPQKKIYKSYKDIVPCILCNKSLKSHSF
jgi:hypothetical protein